MLLVEVARTVISSGRRRAAKNGNIFHASIYVVVVVVLRIKFEYNETYCVVTSFTTHCPIM